MRDEPCSKCGMVDRYHYGEFSYCRPCHNEANRQYRKRKALGEEVEKAKAPSLPLYALNIDNNYERNKVACPAGHPLHGENVRVTSQRKGRHLNRKCRACERNAKRVKYGLEAEQTVPKLSEYLTEVYDARGS